MDSRNWLTTGPLVSTLATLQFLLYTAIRELFKPQVRFCHFLCSTCPLPHITFRITASLLTRGSPGLCNLASATLQPYLLLYSSSHSPLQSHWPPWGFYNTPSSSLENFTHSILSLWNIFIRSSHSLSLHIFRSLLKYHLLGNTHPDIHSKVAFPGFPGGVVVKNPPVNAGDTGSSPGPGRSHMPGRN